MIPSTSLTPLAVSVTAPPAATGSGLADSDVMTGGWLGIVLTISNLKLLALGLGRLGSCVPTVGPVVLRCQVPVTPVSAVICTYPLSGTVKGSPTVLMFQVPMA